ncbi:MAG: cbb3-type cytochrome c oxidase subunit I [Cyclobacteriaceae bacterium]|nr:cbb3-type cytochrome c oxidase subunit I [Cyclobacteriaceae bacterium]MCB0499889.1 cbb3-type cytochrome c oxidase subunit I [Cyclobacteriaceae bacterium]MCB9239181.1 cbb3-type cytochrome c oxidase subunit I [Flammeovirgaceae bacterium]MCO5272669.1 cbb3-type cytochrome c oxidase subunit I [Cyclobacteriaceae bacterium]MCW5902798.1 cbb3-type cytochrome c oxidase subunit I [Cyclobacteriaceae bacterium]
MESIKLRKITSVWILAVFTLFIISIVLGILMRLNQGGVIQQNPVTFYSNMTTHGLTMIGIWFVAGMAAINYLMERYVKTSYTANVFALVLTVIGVLMFWATTFIGKFHAAWTFLYPLPFKVMWATWATPLFLVSLAVFGVGWLVWSVSLMTQILKKYSISQAFAWQHFKKNPSVETPPFILISMITLIGVIACLLAAVVLLVLFFAEYFSNGSFVNDALLMKNLTYFFGHTIANEMLYLGLAVIYELFAEVSGRPKWKTTWYVAVAWNCTLVFILTAFFHHLYMDFVQPEGFQIIGQLASYLASLPAAGVTVFSVFVAVYRTKINWTLTNLLFFIGVAGWVIGGLGAVIDATISNNIVLHNTLWVPAHFHTYNAMGNVLFSIGFFYWFSTQFGEQAKSSNSAKWILGTLIVGGTGFLLAFYLGGADSIPRRYSIYPAELSAGTPLALMGAIFATVYLIAILVFFFNISKRCVKVLSSPA